MVSTRPLLALMSLASAALVACTGTQVATTSGAGSSTAASSGGPSSSGTSSTSSTSSTASSASSSGAGAGGSTPGTVNLTMDSFTVPPGGEVYYCQNWANPFGGVDTDISEFESHMAVGSHHLLLFYRTDVTSNGALESCSGLEFAATPYGSQTLDDSLSFPTGIAALLPGSTGLRIQSHYLNTSSSTVTAHVEVLLHPAPPGTVKNEAAVLFVIDTDINVAPQSSAVVSDDCTVPQDMNVLRTSSHMHMHGTDFLATAAGNTVYETSSWSEPKPELFAPAMTLHQGDPLHFQCSFTNTGSTTLTFGESALTNEMCIFTASFYPAPAGVATIDASGCVGSQK